MKALITNPGIHESARRLHDAGHSVRTWSELRGFRPQTVRNLLAGQYKNRQSVLCQNIRAALVKDGILETAI